MYIENSIPQDNSVAAGGGFDRVLQAHSKQAVDVSQNMAVVPKVEMTHSGGVTGEVHPGESFSDYSNFTLGAMGDRPMRVSLPQGGKGDKLFANKITITPDLENVNMGFERKQDRVVISLRSRYPSADVGRVMYSIRQRTGSAGVEFTGQKNGSDDRGSIQGFPVEIKVFDNVKIEPEMIIQPPREIRTQPQTELPEMTSGDATLYIYASHST
jgi:hypothetical protein